MENNFSAISVFVSLSSALVILAARPIPQCLIL